MQKKCGKFLADWRDASGVRHRKAFDTMKEATAYAQQMRLQAHPESPNPSARRPPSRKLPVSGRARKLKTRTPKRRSRP